MNNLEITSAILNMFYLSSQSCGAPKYMPYLGGRLAKANFFLFVHLAFPSLLRCEHKLFAVHRQGPHLQGGGFSL